MQKRDRKLVAISAGIVMFVGLLFGAYFYGVLIPRWYPVPWPHNIADLTFPITGSEPYWYRHPKVVGVLSLVGFGTLCAFCAYRLAKFLAER